MFCNICGDKLIEGAKFCPNCGAKIEIHRDEIPTKAKIHPSAPSRTKTLLDKYFKNEYQYGEYLLLSSRKKDSEMINILQNKIDKIIDDEPVYCVFNYMGENLKAYWFLISETRFICRYSSDCFQQYLLREIKHTQYGKAILAPIMRFTFSDGTQSDKIYLTSISRPKDFVARFNAFLYELNQP